MRENDLKPLLDGLGESGFLEWADRITRVLAQMLGVPYCLIAHRIGTGALRVRSISFWKSHQWTPPFEYNLAGSPCEKIYQDGFYCFTHSVQKLFPQDADLRKLEIESYAGAPIFNASGATIGHVCVLDTMPIPDIQKVYCSLHEVADSVGPHLEEWSGKP